MAFITYSKNASMNTCFNGNITLSYIVVPHAINYFPNMDYTFDFQFTSIINTITINMIVH